ncbi:MAG: hypothetical protein HGA63_04135 [Syntrophobacteraceae bacterium]|nr:hypothetical protein [Syntrophobacteraceae bacterium]
MASKERFTNDLYDIVVLDLSSEAPHPNNIKITLNSFENDVHPSFGPDGNKIVSARWGAGVFGLVIWDLSSGEFKYVGSQEQWKDSRYLSDPRWSPLGDKILYVDWKWYDQGRFQNIMWVSPDGGESTNLTEGSYDSTQPAWSPDGQFIAFVSKKNGVDGADIWIMDQAGGNMRCLVDCLVDCRDPSFSPDGTRILFTIGAGTQELYTVTVDGGDLSILTSGGFPKVEAEWSPYLTDDVCE